MLVDIGANLTHASFDDDLEAVLARARAAGVETIVVTGSSVAIVSNASIQCLLFECGITPSMRPI